MSADSDPDHPTSADVHHGKDNWADLLEDKEEVGEHEEKTGDPVKEDVIENGDGTVGDDDLNDISCAGETQTRVNDADIDGEGVSDADIDGEGVSDADLNDDDINNADSDEAVTVSYFSKEVDLGDTVVVSSVVKTDVGEVNSDKIVTLSSVINDADLEDADLDEAVTILSVVKDADISDAINKDADLHDVITVSYVIGDAADGEVVDIAVCDDGRESPASPLTTGVDSSEVDRWTQDKMADSMSPWCLVDGAGQVTIMPPATLVVGSQEDCDIRIEEGGVDKRHAMMTFDPANEQFKVQDLGSESGTFVNECRIAEQDCVILEHQSSLRFGDGSLSYRIEKTSRMEKLLPNHEMPNWAKRDFEAGMAECPGCIAEQGIHHTCGMNHLEALAHHVIINPDQLSAPVQFTDSPITYLQHNGHHHQHQHAPPAHLQHCHNKPVAPPKYTSTVGPQWCTVQGNNAKATRSSSAKSNKSSSSARKQAQNVEYIYSPEQPLEGARYMTAPVNGGAPQGVLEMPYQPYRIMHHPLQYTGNQRMPLVAPLMQSPQTFVSCSHGSYGDILYAAEQYHRMCHQKQSSDSQYQQYHLVKHMYNVPVTHSNIVYSDAPTFVNSGVMQDVTPIPPQCIDGATQKLMCDAPDAKQQEVAMTKSKSVSTERLYNDVASPRRGSCGSGRSSSSCSTPESPVVHRVDKRRSLAGTDSELETVKKCTPLYGQPSWWGGWYDDGADEKPSQDISKVKDKHSGTGPCPAERPSFLTLHSSTPPPSSSPSHTVPSPGPVVPPGACWYTVEVIKPVVDIPSHVAVAETCLTESDRLLEDFKQRSLKAALWTPPERDPGPGDTTQHHTLKLQNSKPRINMSGTAFTIDLRDGNSSPEMPKINMGDSLSKFLPHKVRRSFKERSDKVERSSVKKALVATAAAKQKTARWQRRKSTTAVSPKMKRKPFGSPSLQRRSGYLSDGHHSAFSSDNEDTCGTSEVILSAKSRRCQTSLSQRSGVIERQNSAKLKAASKKTSTAACKTTGQTKVSKTAGRGKEGPSSYLEARQLRHSHQAGKARDAQRKSPQPKSTRATSKTAKSVYKSLSAAESPKSCRHGLQPEPPEDNISDAGTYTIDCDEEIDVNKSDVQQARNDIDRLFGLDSATELQTNCSAPETRTNAKPNNNNEIDVGKMSLEELMKQNDPSQRTSSENAAVSSNVHQVTSYPGDSTGLPQWVCQWSGAATSPTEVDDSQAMSHAVKQVSGRKLPNLPVKPLQSSREDEEGDDVDNTDYLPDDITPPTVDESGRRRATVSYDGTRGERFTISFDAPATPPPPRHVASGVAETASVTDDIRNGLDERTVDDKTSCENDVTVPVSFVIPVSQGMPDSDYGNETTNRLNAAVLYELMKSGKSRRQSTQNVPVESRRTHAIDEKIKRNKTPWKRQPPVGLHRNHVSMDDHSESEASCVSDLSTDCSLSSPHGRMKMPLSSMRTNRTFALRRARLNSSESDSSPKPSTSVQQEKKPKSRPSSATDVTSRRKSDKVSTKKPEEKLVRKDGGRFSMRVTKTTSMDQSSARSSEPRDTSRRGKPSSNIVRSLSTSGVKSQPSSRSNSPRSQEYNSWKRRKEYDPRRAVTEAKHRDSVAKQASKSDASSDAHRHGRHAKSATSSVTPSVVSSSSTLVQATGSSRNVTQKDCSRQEAAGDVAAGSDDGMEERIMQLSSEISHDILALVRADDTEDFTADYSEKSMTIISTDTSVTHSAFCVPKTKHSHSPSLHTPPNLRSCDSSGTAGDCPLDENENQASHVAVVPSIYHMSTRLKMQADRIFKKLGNRGSQTGGVSPPPTADGLTDEELTIDGQLMLTMHNLRHIEYHLTAIEEGVPASTRMDSVGSHHNLEWIRRDIIGFRPIEKPSGKTVVTKSCGITEI